MRAAFRCRVRHAVQGQARGCVFFDTQGRSEPLPHDIDIQKEVAKVENLTRGDLMKGDLQKQNHLAGRLRDILRQPRAGKLSYGTAIRTLSFHGMAHEALAHFKTLEQLVTDGKVKRIMRETPLNLLQAMAKRKGFLDDAVHFLAHAKRKGYHLCDKCHVEMLKIHARNNDTAGAKALAAEMRGQGWALGYDGHRALLLGCRDMAEAAEVVEQLRIEGLSVDDIRIWNAMLHVCKACANARVAASVVQKIRDGGHQVTLRSYTTLLQCYSAQGDIKGISDTYDVMVRSGIPLDSVAYVVLIDGLLPWAANDDIATVCESAVSTAFEHVHPSQVDGILLALLRLYALRGDVESAERTVLRIRNTSRDKAKADLLQEARRVRHERDKEDTRLERSRREALASMRR